MSEYIKKSDCTKCINMSLNTAEELCYCGFFNEDLKENVVQCSAFAEKYKEEVDLKEYKVTVTPNMKEFTCTIKASSEEEAKREACDKYMENITLTTEVEA